MTRNESIQHQEHQKYAEFPESICPVCTGNTTAFLNYVFDPSHGVVKPYQVIFTKQDIEGLSS